MLGGLIESLNPSAKCIYLCSCSFWNHLAVWFLLLTAVSSIARLWCMGQSSQWAFILLLWLDGGETGEIKATNVLNRSVLLLFGCVMSLCATLLTTNGALVCRSSGFFISNSLLILLLRYTRGGWGRWDFWLRDAFLQKLVCSRRVQRVAYIWGRVNIWTGIVNWSESLGSFQVPEFVEQGVVFLLLECLNNCV